MSLFVFVARYLGGDRRKSLRDDRSVIRTGFLSFWWRRTSSGVTKCDQMRDQSVHCIKITKMRYMERRYLSHYRKSVKNCFATQNFTEILTEIGKSAAELWLKTIFLNDGCPPSWILKIFIFGHVTHRVPNLRSICVPNFIKLGSIFVEIWRFHRIHHLEF